MGGAAGVCSSCRPQGPVRVTRRPPCGQDPGVSDGCLGGRFSHSVAPRPGEGPRLDGYPGVGPLGKRWAGSGGTRWGSKEELMLLQPDPLVARPVERRKVLAPQSRAEACRRRPRPRPTRRLWRLANGDPAGCTRRPWARGSPGLRGPARGASWRQWEDWRPAASRRHSSDDRVGGRPGVSGEARYRDLGELRCGFLARGREPTMGVARATSACACRLKDAGPAP